MANYILNPYLLFSNNAEEAVTFYKSVFGGEVTISRFGDNPGMPVEEKYKNLVMHADLVSDSIRLMASDAEPSGGVTKGDSVNLSLSGEDAESLRAIFEKLSEGATVEQPLTAAPWGDEFGMLVDKYGFKWMVNITKPAV